MLERATVDDLTGRVAVVTGAGRGLGRLTALELARRGASVVVNDLGVWVDGSGPPDPGVADAVVAEIVERGGEAVAHNGDVGSWANAESLIATAVSAFGSLDILVNNAGVLRRGPMVDLGEADLDALYHVHLKGTLATIHHAARHWSMAGATDSSARPAVINLTSRAGLEPHFDVLTWYGAVKSAVALASVAAANELHDLGVRVNAIAPLGATRMASYTFADSGSPAEFVEDTAALEGNSVPSVVAWLASARADAVTGEVFLVGDDAVSRYAPWRRQRTVSYQGHWDPERAGHELTQLVGDSA